MRAQQESMANFFHGQGNTYPSQIKLLVQASYTYFEMFDKNANQPTQKNKTMGDIKVHTLKKSLSIDNSRQYICGYDITALDLEKKNRTGDMLLSGRQILDMAKRGNKAYRKSISIHCT